MPTHLEFALMSKQVYFPEGGFVLGWTNKELLSDDSGLRAVVYVNDKNDMVIAFRGTDTSNLDNFLKNMMTNFDIARGNPPSTVACATQYVESVRNKRSMFDRLIDLVTTKKQNVLYLTGHSLGGTIAALVGFTLLKKQAKKYNVVTFDNPGIAHHICPVDLAQYSQHFQAYFLTYLVDPSLINTRHPYIGEVIHVHVKPHSPSVYEKGKYNFYHAVDCVVNDFLRAILLLMLLAFLLANVFADNSFIRTLSNVTQEMSDLMHKHGYIKSIVTSEPSSRLFYFLLSLGLLIITKAINNVYALTSRQHPIDVIINEFTKGKGYPANFSEMQKWPNYDQFLISQVKHWLMWADPRKHPSTINIYEPLKLHDNMIKSIEGYTTKKSP